MDGPQVTWLSDGRRLHLNHGPIDLIIEAAGPDRDQALEQAIRRFETILREIVDELPLLRAAARPGMNFRGAVARRMQAAVVPHLPAFITPMAAVAGSVADEILSAMMAETRLIKAHVNNGGDVAFHVSGCERIEAAVAAPGNPLIALAATDPWRGMATSGRGGRSHSLGIADSVTVIAGDAAAADAAATVIANAVDLPGHPAVERVPARDLSPDSDLGQRLVTTAVGPLSARETARALDNGTAHAALLLESGLIGGAVLILNRSVRLVGAAERLALRQGDLTDA